MAQNMQRKENQKDTQTKYIMKKIVEIQTQIQQLMHKIGDHSNDNGKMILKFDLLI